MNLIRDVFSKITFLKLQPQYGGVEWLWLGDSSFSIADGPMALDISEFRLTHCMKTHFISEMCV